MFAAHGYNPEPEDYTSAIVVLVAGILGYLYARGTLKMDKIIALVMAMFRNNGTGTESKEFDFGDFADAIQAALIAAAAIGVAAMAQHLGVLADASTGVTAAVLAGVVMGLKVIANYLSDNG